MSPESIALNAAISEVCDDTSVGFEAYGGKTIPYIGWYWRTVDFDADGYSFGVMPDRTWDSVAHARGFMESNKWGYPSTRKTTPEEWKVIKDALRKATASRDPEDFAFANLLIQSVPVKEASPSCKSCFGTGRDHRHGDACFVCGGYPGDVAWANASFNEREKEFETDGLMEVQQVKAFDVLAAKGGMNMAQLMDSIREQE